MRWESLAQVHLDGRRIGCVRGPFSHVLLLGIPTRHGVCGGIYFACGMVGGPAAVWERSVRCLWRPPLSTFPATRLTLILLTFARGRKIELLLAILPFLTGVSCYVFIDIFLAIVL